MVSRDAKRSEGPALRFASRLTGHWNATMDSRLAILETSHRSGWVALAHGERLLATRRLSEARRHTRDLAPMLAELLAEQNWKARDLHGVIVSRGPGSYTGLRVGVMSAKTLAYATGCALLAVDTFAAIALQADKETRRQGDETHGTIEVIADAQQEKIYVQRFRGTSSGQTKRQEDKETRRQGDESAPACLFIPLSPCKIVAFEDWKSSLTPEIRISGPGLEIFSSRLPSEQVVAMDDWLPRPESLLRLGLEKLASGRRDDPLAVEPLYLRPSSAEEKFRGPASRAP